MVIVELNGILRVEVSGMIYEGTRSEVIKEINQYRVKLELLQNKCIIQNKELEEASLKLQEEQS